MTPAVLTRRKRVSSSTVKIPPTAVRLTLTARSEARGTGSPSGSVRLSIGEKIGKSGAFGAASILVGVASLSYLAVNTAAPYGAAVALAMLAGMSEGGQMFAYSIFSNCIRLGGMRHGAVRAESILSSIFKSGEKLGFALGASVAGVIFALTRLVETQEEFTQQPGSTIRHHFRGLRGSLRDKCLGRWCHPILQKVRRSYRAGQSDQVPGPKRDDVESWCRWPLRCAGTRPVMVSVGAVCVSVSPDPANPRAVASGSSGQASSNRSLHCWGC